MKRALILLCALVFLNGCATNLMMSTAKERGSSCEASGPAPGMVFWGQMCGSIQEVKKKILCPQGVDYERREARVQYRGPDPRYDIPQSPGYAQVYARSDFECQMP